MGEVDHAAIAETMNEYYKDLGASPRAEPLGSDGGWALDLDGGTSVLGRGIATDILEEHDAILLKATEVDGAQRMWFGKLDREEVTKTVEVTEEQYTVE